MRREDRSWRITPEPVIGPRYARTRWANPPYGSSRLFKTHDAGKARGHASLMEPTPRCPGVSSVALAAIALIRTRSGAVGGTDSTVASSNLPLLKIQPVA